MEILQGFGFGKNTTYLTGCVVLNLADHLIPIRLKRCNNFVVVFIFPVFEFVNIPAIGGADVVILSGIFCKFFFVLSPSGLGPLRVCFIFLRSSTERSSIFFKPGQVVAFVFRRIPREPTKFITSVSHSLGHLFDSKQLNSHLHRYGHQRYR